MSNISGLDALTLSTNIVLLKMLLLHYIAWKEIVQKLYLWPDEQLWIFPTNS